MANFYVVYRRQQENSLGMPAEPKYASAAILSSPESAQVVKVECTTVAEAQNIVQHFYQGHITGTPVVVTEAAFKES